LDEFRQPNIAELEQRQRHPVGQHQCRTTDHKLEAAGDQSLDALRYRHQQRHTADVLQGKVVTAEEEHAGGIDAFTCSLTAPPAQDSGD
jgi:hypothetical protein